MAKPKNKKNPTDEYLSSPDIDGRAFADLKQTIDAGNAIAFVGAGLSARAGFANWDDLLNKLSRSAEPLHRQLETEDLAWWADDARQGLGDDDYHGFLRDHFGRKPTRDAAVEAFARLKFQHIFTTNYDLSIEKALEKYNRKRGYEFSVVNWQQPDAASTVIQSFARNDPERRYLVYLHGRYDDPQRIVLGETDYRNTYVRSDETIRKLFAIFSLRRVVFFGFSMRDPDVLAVFRQVLAANKDAQHYAVLSDDNGHNRPRYTKRYGIQPIFYKTGGKEHPNFARLVFDLAGLDEKERRALRPRPKKMPAATWASRPAFKTDHGRVDPEDPQKGRFGGKAEAKGRKLSATVGPSPDIDGWFVIDIKVTSTSGRPLRGKVDLWVHDSFPQEHYWSRVRNGEARFTFSAYGAFTIGATCDGGRTALELDLSTIPKAPREFREN